jgi:hypothetical protein
VTKIGCVVQGDLRIPVEPVLRELRLHCDLLILSTWQDQQPNVPEGDYFKVLINEKPVVAGFSNRNLQRRSTAAGVRLAATEGCTHILKWRTDMLPTRLSRETLLRWCGERPVAGQDGRIVMSAFRQLTVEPDWFSSFPDLFAFGETASMKTLWHDEDFDYTQQYNMPARMRNDCGCRLLPGDMISLLNREEEDIYSIYNAHVELYAIFKNRIQQQNVREYNHAEIVHTRLRLIDHRRLGICWLKSAGRLPVRAIMQAGDTPWWTEAEWQLAHRASRVLPIKHGNRQLSLLRILSRDIRIYTELFLQIVWLAFFRLRRR